MAEIRLELVLSDPHRSEGQLAADVRRFLAARGAFKRMVGSTVSLHIKDSGKIEREPSGYAR